MYKVMFVVLALLFMSESVFANPSYKICQGTNNTSELHYFKDCKKGNLISVYNHADVLAACDFSKQIYSYPGYKGSIVVFCVYIGRVRKAYETRRRKK